MTAIRTILVIVDPTAKQHPAVAKAGVLAEKFSARLDLFACESAVKRIFLGSTAESVLERLPCDALIVKAPNFGELLVL